MNTKLQIRARLSFPSLFRAKTFEDGGKPRYEASFLLDPSDKAGAKSIKQIREAIEHLRKTELKGAKLPEEKTPLRDGNTKDYDGYEDMFFVSASNQKRPQVVGRDRSPVSEEDAEAPYAGCYVNAVITLWAQNNKFGKRINASIEAVQFVKDGEAFGAPKVNVEDEFEDLSDADDEDLDDDNDDLD